MLNTAADHRRCGTGIRVLLGLLGPVLLVAPRSLQAELPDAGEPDAATTDPAAQLPIGPLAPSPLIHDPGVPGPHPASGTGAGTPTVAQLLAAGTLPGLVDEAMKQLAQRQNRQALEAVARREYPAALEGFRSAQALDPHHPQIANNLAYLYQLLGNREAARAHYERTLQLDPARAIAHLNFADLLAAPGATEAELTEAAAHLTRARELRGNQPLLIRRQARLAARRHRWEEAARFYQELLRLGPPDDELRLELGDFYREQGQEAAALGWYREIRDRSSSAGPGRGDQPAELCPPVPPEFDPAQDERVDSAFCTEALHALPDRAPGRSTSAEDAPARQAAQRIWELEVAQEARRYGWSPNSPAVTGTAAMLATRGRILAGQGEHAAAERLLREAIAAAPDFSVARTDLGDLLRQLGRLPEAEGEYLRAVAIDQGHPEAAARLGELYLAWPGGGRGAEAAIFLGRALNLRPDWTELHLELAEAFRLTGDLPRALLHLERFLPTAGSEEKRARALTLRQSLLPLVVGAGGTAGPAAGSATRPPDPGAAQSGVGASGTVAGRGAHPPDPQQERERLRRGSRLATLLGRARALLARGEPEAAMVELRQLSAEERETPILNLEAQILFAAGQPDQAAATWRRSLELDPRQPEVHEQLGLLAGLQSHPQQAWLHLRLAEELGSRAALFHLARLELPADRPPPLGWLADLGQLRALHSADGRLERFLAQGATAAYREEALRLRDLVQARLQAALLFGGLLAALCVAALLLAGSRIWGGHGLRELLVRHPAAGPEVQRILAAIRHEVLKHNTLVLTGLVTELEQGRAAARTAAHLRDSLFGSRTAPGGAYARLRHYLSQLRQLGRAHGLRLNLAHRDPAISTLLRGFGLLRRTAPVFGQVDQLRGHSRRRLLRRLRTAARLLNQEGYEAVRGLLEQLRVLEVDRTLLRTLFARTCGEPAFQRIDPPELVLDEALELPCAVAVPRAAFEDIFTNLFRNALQSSLRHGQGEVACGLGVRSEVDAITGLERIVFLVRDRSPQVLTTEMIRGRFIEEGLGLTADLVSRYEGSLDVWPGDAGWSKAVVVKFPRAGQPEQKEEHGA